MKHVGYPDKPVASITEDLFHVEVYVDALCQFIETCDTPMTVSIQGDSSSGKTSMMNMMRAKMADSIWPVWFNTWQFSQFDMGNSLAFSMMDVLLKGVNCDSELREKIVKGIAGFGRKFITVATDHVLGGASAEIVDELASGPDADYATEIMNLKEKFQNAIDAVLQKSGRNRVVIFVDDLDRLQPAKAVELLEVLKLFLDCENCVFVLAVDYEVVTQGIRQKFGEGVSEEKGRSFFDKIIQLPFKMPVANYDIRKYVREMMEKMGISTDEKEVELFYQLIATSIGFNPRSMKRLFNTYQLLDIVTKNTVSDIGDDVRRRVLFAIICIQMSFEKLYLYFSTTMIDEDTFAPLVDPGQCEAAIREIYGVGDGAGYGVSVGAGDGYDTGNDSKAETRQISGVKTLDDATRREISRIQTFLPHFVEALQVDDVAELSAEELNNFRVIMKCSLVTSVSSNAEESGNDRDWNIRAENRALVKAVAAKLDTMGVGKFNVWAPRKERADIRISDVSAWCVYPGKGFTYSMEYYLSSVGAGAVSVKLLITVEEKDKAGVFHQAFGKNPLGRSVLPKMREDNGRYIYEDMLTVNPKDVDGSAEKITTMVKDAREKVVKVLGV
jgi:hypothetical protein